MVIPLSTLDDSMLLHSVDGESHVLIESNLFIASKEKDADISPFLEDGRVESILYPSTKNINRHLMYKAEEGVGSTRVPDPYTMARFYMKEAGWDCDPYYLEDLQENGEKVFALWCGRSLATCAYTTKGCRQLNNLFTREDCRGRGYATRILEMAGPVYVFVDDLSLLPFYNTRGFETKATYALYTRRQP